MLINLLQTDRYTYDQKNKRYNLSGLSQLIRAGNELYIRDKNGTDVTQETLVYVALREVLPNIPDKRPDLLDVLAILLPKDLLYEIIEEGGVLQYITRRNIAARRK